MNWPQHEHHMIEAESRPMNPVYSYRGYKITGKLADPNDRGIWSIIYPDGSIVSGSGMTFDRAKGSLDILASGSLALPDEHGR